jgi:hypothetical protein
MAEKAEGEGKSADGEGVEGRGGNSDGACARA